MNFLKKNCFKILNCIFFSFIIAILALKLISLVIPDNFNLLDWQVYIWGLAILLLPITFPILKKYIRTYIKSLSISNTISTYSELFWVSQIWILLIVFYVHGKYPFFQILQNNSNLIIDDRICILVTINFVSLLNLSLAIIFSIKNKASIIKQKSELVDLYGREPYVYRLSQLIINHFNGEEIISSSSTNEASPTIWINAKWGQGKTFVLKLLKNELLRNNYSLIVVEFQPTDYIINENTIEKIVQSFYQEVINRISEDYFVPELSNQLRRYSKIVTQKAQESFLGFSPFVVFEEPENIKFKISALLKKYNINLVLVYDDIDRLMSIEILLFLKLVRITNNFENTISIISASLSEVTNCLKENFEFEDTELYVNKFYDILSEVPPIPSDNLFDKLALELKGVYGEEKNAYRELVEIFGNANYLGEIHHGCINNIRKQEQVATELKRFIAYKDDLCWSDAIRISVIKLFNGGEVYNLLKESKNEVCGESSINSGNSNQQDTFFYKLDQILKNSEENRDTNTIKIFLCYMFPKIQQHYEGHSFTNRRQFAIYDADYFERYFYEFWLNDWLQIGDINEIKRQLEISEIDFKRFTKKELSWAFRMFSREKDQYNLSNEQKKNLSIWLIGQKLKGIEYVNGFFTAEASDYITYDSECDKAVLKTFFEYGKLPSDTLFFDGFNYVNKIYWHIIRDLPRYTYEENYLKELTSIALKELIKKINNKSENILFLRDNLDDSVTYFGFYRNVSKRFDEECFGGKFKIEHLVADACEAEIKENIDSFIVWTLSYRENPTINGKIDWESESPFFNDFRKDTPVNKIIEMSKEYLEKNNLSEKYKKYLHDIVKILEAEAVKSK